MTAFATDTGLADFVTALLASNTIKFIGMGGGSGQDETDTDLASAHTEARATGTLSAQTTETAGDTYRVVGTITAAAGKAVTEVGVFAAATGAAMRFYGDFPVIDLLAGDSITFTIDVVVDQA